jgi:hypothetical protein
VSIQSEWRSGMSGDPYIDWSGVDVILRRRHEPDDPELFKGLQLCAQVAVEALREIKASKNGPF